MKKLLMTWLLSFILCNHVVYAGGSITPNKDHILIKTSSWYIGIGAVWAKLTGCNLKKCSYEDVTYGGVLRVGYDYNDYLGMEVRAMKTFLDEGPYGGTPLQHIGFFVKPKYIVTKQINLYALLGYAYTENLGNEGRLTYFNNDSGFSAGVGTEYKFLTNANARWSVFIDYQRLLIKANVADLDMISFGLKYRF